MFLIQKQTYLNIKSLFHIIISITENSKKDKDKMTKIL